MSSSLTYVEFLISPIAFGLFFLLFGILLIMQKFRFREIAKKDPSDLRLPGKAYSLLCTALIVLSFLLSLLMLRILFIPTYMPEDQSAAHTIYDVELVPNEDFQYEGNVITGKETIRVPLNRVVVIRRGWEEILLIFSPHPEEHPDKLHRRIYRWHSIEKIGENHYRFISEGSDDLYEKDYHRIGFREYDDKTLIEIDDFVMPWSYSNNKEAGYLYYNDEKYEIEITNYESFSEYLSHYLRIDYQLRDTNMLPP